MKHYHLAKGESPKIDRIVEIAYPGYKGRKIRIAPFSKMSINSYWSGGSRDYFVFVNLLTKQVFETPQNGTMFDSHSLECNHLPENIALIEHSIFCGKDCGITIYFPPTQFNALLPSSPQEISEEEKLVLAYTAKLKNSYGGRKNIRFHEANRETGIDQESWENAKLSCIEKRLLNKRGAITASGRNHI